MENDKFYATETYVVNKIAEAELAGGDVDLSGYATKEDIADKITMADMTTYIAENKEELRGPQGDTGPKGDKGDKGNSGEDGYTPVKGEDYYTPEDKSELLDELSKAFPEDGVSEWADIKNKPGDIITEEGFVDLAKTAISDVSAETDSAFSFEIDALAAKLNVGDKLFACISMNAPTESSYMESEVVDVEGTMFAVFNSSQNPFDIIDSMQFIKNDATLPAFVMTYEIDKDNGNAYGAVLTDADYTGYNFTAAIKRTISRFIKLTNDALDLDENPTQYSKKPISSGGAFEAIKDVEESTAKAIKDVEESTAEVFIVTTRIELTPQFVVSGPPSHTF